MYEACLNCGSHSFRGKYYIKQTERNIVTCKKCGLVQINPRNDMLNVVDHEDVSLREDKLQRLFALMEKDTGQKLKDIMEKETATKRQYFKERMRDIGRYKSSGRLLDVGCGQGAFLSACRGANFQVFGVEPSKYTYAESLKIAPDSTIYNCTLLEAQFSKDSFDVVTLINTLEHLVNPKETISEIYRILKPDGVLMLETPNIGHWIPRLLGKRWVQLLVTDHVVFFSKTVLKTMLKEIGFEVKETKCSHKTMSIRLFQFHLSRYFMSFNKSILKMIERKGLANKRFSFPQWDEMLVFATKLK